MGQGRAPGVGSQHRAADATAGSRHSRPRGSQAAHAGARGGKMRVILRRIQRAYFRRNRRAGSRATSVAVRHRRRVHAHMHFSGFSYKNFAETGPISRLRVVLLQNPCGGTKCACFRACARVCRGGSRHARGGCGRVEPIHAVFAHGCCSCGRRSAAARPGAPLKNRPAYALQLCLGHF